MQDIGELISTSTGSFLGTSGNDTKKDAYFDQRSLDSDTPPLQTLGYDTYNLELGSVVAMTAEEFVSMTYIPKGLTYDVTCGTNSNGKGNSNGNGNGNRNGKKNGTEPQTAVSALSF